MPVPIDSEGNYVTHAEFQQFERAVSVRFDRLETLLNRPTNWGWVIAAVLGMVTIGAMALSSTTAPLKVHMEHQGKQIAQLRYDLEKHELLPGHTDALVQHARHDERFGRLQDESERHDEQIKDIEGRARVIESSRYTPDDHRADQLRELLERMLKP